MLQIDGRHRFGRGWDTHLVQRLHDCEAGKNAVLTGALPGFTSADTTDPHSESHFYAATPKPSTQVKWSEEGLPLFAPREVEVNADKLSRPIETMAASSHFAFSHGNLAKVASHDPSFDNAFAWEELWMTYTYWKNGFTLYAPVDHDPYAFYIQPGMNE